MLRAIIRYHADSEDFIYIYRKTEIPYLLRTVDRCVKTKVFKHSCDVTNFRKYCNDIYKLT